MVPGTRRFIRGTAQGRRPLSASQHSEAIMNRTSRSSPEYHGAYTRRQGRLVERDEMLNSAHSLSGALREPNVVRSRILLAEDHIISLTRKREEMMHRNNYEIDFMQNEQDANVARLKYLQFTER